MNPGTVVKVAKVVYDKNKEAKEKHDAEQKQKNNEMDEEMKEITEKAKKAFDDEDFTEEDFQKMLEEDMDAMKKRGEA